MRGADPPGHGPRTRQCLPFQRGRSTFALAPYRSVHVEGFLPRCHVPDLRDVPHTLVALVGKIQW